MYWNCVHIETATSFKAHLAMAAKLLEIKPQTEGVVVECGCFQGGSAANLSLACKLAGRDLILYDSFEGLPPARRATSTPSPTPRAPSSVRSTRCATTSPATAPSRSAPSGKGWFKDTLPHHTEHDRHDVPRRRLPGEHARLPHQPVAQAAELRLRVHRRVRPRRLLRGVLLGALLAHLLRHDPARDVRRRHRASRSGSTSSGPCLATPPLQSPGSIGYTFKGSSGYWDYFPEDHVDDDPADAEVAPAT